jgi:hypothetical protein
MGMSVANSLKSVYGVSVGDGGRGGLTASLFLFALESGGGLAEIRLEHCADRGRDVFVGAS